MSQRNRQVLFVCTGNICRSPMAEYLFRHRVGPDTEWSTCSAGVFAMHGSPASQHAVEALAEWGIDLVPHRSQPVTRELIDASDLIAVMTDQHRQDIVFSYPEASERTRLLTAFGTGQDSPNISDPIGSSLHVYRTVRDQIDSALADIILHIRKLEQP